MSCHCVDSAQLNGLVSFGFIPDEAPHLGSFDKEDTQGELKKPLSFLSFVLLLPNLYLKIDACYVCVSPRRAPGIFSIRFECCGISTAQ